MKTLTITISDEAAENLARAVEGSQRTPEEVAARVVEDAYADWGDLSDDDITAIEEGLADFERGDTIPHDQVVSELKQKYGW
jgi:predicted transcriptional regulator